MGILTLTPDSFSDGGQFNELEKAKRRIQEMIKSGASIIDIGGESTGPGAPDISADEELNRVKPIIDFISENGLIKKAIFSIDTYKSVVAEYALSHGFHMVNDVTALRGDENMLSVLLKYKPYIVLMYSKDSTARTTRESVEYDDVMHSVKAFLRERMNFLKEAGFPKQRIIVDPGMGMFLSANPKYSFEVITRLEELKTLECPVLIGISRKSCLGGPLEERDGPSVEWSMKAIQNGAAVIRIHDVEGFQRVLKGN